MNESIEFKPNRSFDRLINESINWGELENYGGIVGLLAGVKRNQFLHCGIGGAGRDLPEGVRRCEGAVRGPLGGELLKSAEEYTVEGESLATQCTGAHLL